MPEFHFLAFICPAFTIPFIKETVFPHFIFFLFWKLLDHINMGLCLESLFYSIDLFLFMLVPYCFDYYLIIVYYKIREHDTSNYVLLSLDCFGYSGSSVGPYKL